MRLFLMWFIVGVMSACSSTAQKKANFFQEKPMSFEAWKTSFFKKAKDAGVSEEILEKHFQNVSFNRKIILLDRKQPEGMLSLDVYRKKVIERVGGPLKKKLKDVQRRKRLDTIEERYGVPRGVVLALWGTESFFGKNIGNTPLIEALANLSYEGRRREFFEKELLILLKLYQEKKIFHPQKVLKGSWAGAMGQCQFMPSSFEKAVDGNGDGRIDIFSQEEDVLASIANYLHQEGWRAQERIFDPVQLPGHFSPTWISLDSEQTIQAWSRLGIKGVRGGTLPSSDTLASLIRPDGAERGEAFLVYKNFKILMKWNKSQRFALTIGTLANLSKVQNK